MKRVASPQQCNGLARLLDGRFLLALGVLVANDHWAKARYGNAITGKLSDFAGMVVLPLLLISVAEAVTKRLAQPEEDRERWLRVSALIISGLLLLAIKVSPPAADAVAGLLEALTGAPQTIVADPTDLIGLIALVFSDRIARRPRPLPIRRLTRPARITAVSLGLLACLATSYDEDSGWVDLEVEANGDVVASAVAYDDWGRSSIVSRDGGRTWSTTSTWRTDQNEAESQDDEPTVERGPLCLEQQPDICIRTSSERNDSDRTRSQIDESSNGGTTWTPVWTVEDTSAFWVTEAYGYNGSIWFGDIALLDDDTVLVSAAHLEPVRRDPVSGEWSPTPRQVQELPGQWLVVLLMTSIPLIGAVRRARGRSLESIIWFCVGGAVFLAGSIGAGDSVGPGIVVGSAAAVGLLIVLAVLCVTSMEKRTPRDYALRWCSAGSALVAIAFPMVLFDVAVVSWGRANLASLILVVVASVAAGLVGEPPPSAVGGTKRTAPPPPSPDSMPLTPTLDPTGSMAPPPPSAAAIAPPPASTFPTALLILTPLVALPGALLLATLLEGALRLVGLGFGDVGSQVAGLVGSFLLPLLSYGIVAGLWSERVMKNSGWNASRLRVRSIVLGTTSVVGPVSLGIAGAYWLAATAAFAIPHVVMRAGTTAPDAEPDTDVPTSLQGPSLQPTASRSRHDPPQPPLHSRT